MHYLCCEQFTDGGPAPAVYYAARLKEAFREVCAFYKGRQRVQLTELEPLWHFVETMAMARLFGVSRPLYDQIDRQIAKMNRGMLVKLALQCFLTPSLEQYLEALRSGAVLPHDAVMLYLRLRATMDWMEDNTFLVEHPVDGLDTLLLRFRQVIDENQKTLHALSRKQPEIRALWHTIVAYADRRFLTPEYTNLIA